MSTDAANTRLPSSAMRKRSADRARWARVVAAIVIVACCLFGAGEMAAAPSCPGMTTSDGLACCAPGATPTTDDACQLPGGGQAASCPLAQLTSSGSCCPPGSTAQPDGTCQLNGYTVDGCALGQLDKGGLVCCPAGTMPQADGSCPQSASQPPPTNASTPPTNPAGLSACPSNFVYQPATNNCTGAPVGCPALPATVDGGALAGLPEPALTGALNASFVLGCCPWGSGQSDPTMSVCYNGAVAVQPDPPICPPGSKPINFWNTGVYFCVAPVSCPVRFHVEAGTGLCALDPFVFAPLALKEIELNDPGPCKNDTVPRRGFAGDDACVKTAIAAQTLLQNTAAPSHTNADGVCLPGYAWRRYAPIDHVCVQTVPASGATSTSVQPTRGGATSVYTGVAPQGPTAQPSPVPTQGQAAFVQPPTSLQTPCTPGTAGCGAPLIPLQGRTNPTNQSSLTPLTQTPNKGPCRDGLERNADGACVRHKQGQCEHDCNDQKGTTKSKEGKTATRIETTIDKPRIETKIETSKLAPRLPASTAAPKLNVPFKLPLRKQ